MVSPRTLFCALSTLLFIACTDGVQPHIDAIIPASGHAGDLVHIIGGDFDTTTVEVSFGGYEARVVQVQARRVIVEVPKKLSGLVPVVVTADGHVSGAFDFWVDDPPLVDGGP
ncbi:MAG: IPT/TIG domain-containing protein [Deltaproteobacteria bacterium]|nr:IPT/TIG domain-containing protein [Deltaproteobacteria bacterium]